MSCGEPLGRSYRCWGEGESGSRQGGWRPPTRGDVVALALSRSPGQSGTVPQGARSPWAWLRVEERAGGPGVMLPSRREGAAAAGGFVGSGGAGGRGCGGELPPGPPGGQGRVSAARSAGGDRATPRIPCPRGEPVPAVPGRGAGAGGAQLCSTDGRARPTAVRWAASSTARGAPRDCAGDGAAVPARGSWGARGSAGSSTEGILSLSCPVLGKGPVLLGTARLCGPARVSCLPCARAVTRGEVGSPGTQPAGCGTRRSTGAWHDRPSGLVAWLRQAMGTRGLSQAAGGLPWEAAGFTNQVQCGLLLLSKLRLCQRRCRVRE